jgi:colicin import membrane protein
MAITKADWKAKEAELFGALQRVEDEKARADAAEAALARCAEAREALEADNRMLQGQVTQIKAIADKATDRAEQAEADARDKVAAVRGEIATLTEQTKAATAARSEQEKAKLASLRDEMKALAAEAKKVPALERKCAQLVALRDEIKALKAEANKVPALARRAAESADLREGLKTLKAEAVNAARNHSAALDKVTKERDALRAAQKQAAATLAQVASKLGGADE